MDVCEICIEWGNQHCEHCQFGNPCLGCSDYDEDNDICISDGGCGKEQK